ncbi:DUF2860 domain-containing protein [Grimontia kaedaensis]|uniref:DUF2860 domain-containing protein n=1 Tax=Grimontia kaedaensis TaxID=2872157 RepID=A0ABY4X0G8_9GAMM|nr:DUF2860 family protein [Grimontia kaedaensis]USH04741.1 DUF2860 domain-containing protein [Grimontia kaedaensis]
MNLPIGFKAKLLLALSPLFSSATFAEEDMFTPGFSGALSVNVGASSSQSQGNTDDDNAVTNDLESSGKAISQTAPFILGRLQYSFGDTVIFVGNSEEQIAEAQFQGELGIVHRFNNGLSLTTALFGNVPSADEVWQDPYLTNSERITTEQTVAGVRFAMGLHTPLPITLKYAYAYSEVDSENIGVSQALSDQDSKLLARDSDYHRFGAEAALPLNPSILIAPSLYYTLRDAKGDAKSFDKISAQLSLVLNHQQHHLVTTVRVSKAYFSTANPVFKLKQDDDSKGIFSVYSFSEPLGWRNTQIHIMGGYQSTDSDITFYDSENTFISTGFSYRF